MSYISINASGVLGYRSSINLNSTSDQSIGISSAKYVIRKILVTNASMDMTLSIAAGGVYSCRFYGKTWKAANSAFNQSNPALSGFTDYMLVNALNAAAIGIANKVSIRAKKSFKPASAALKCSFLPS